MVPSAVDYPGIDRMSASQIEKVTPGLWQKYKLDEEMRLRKHVTDTTHAAQTAERQSIIDDKIERKNADLDVPGIGRALTAMDAKTIKGAAEMKDKFDRQINEMISLREKHNGGALFNREDVARGKQLSKDLLLTYKDMAKLGVLSAADEEILNAIIPPDPLAYHVAGVIGQDPIKTRLEGFRDDANFQYEKSLGLRLRQREAPKQDPIVNKSNEDLSQFKRK
jgi:hypothetical protein